MEKDLKPVWFLIILLYISIGIISIINIVKESTYSVLILFFMPLMFTFILCILESGAKQYEKIRKENEEYYQKMKSGYEKPVIRGQIKNEQRK